MTYEAPKLLSSHKHTKCTTTHGAITAEQNPETDSYTSSEWENTLKHAGKAETLHVNP